MSVDFNKQAKMTFEEVVDRGRDFLEKKGGFYGLLLTKILFDESTGLWTVEFNIGYFTSDLVMVKINDETGSIVAYERESR